MDTSLIDDKETYISVKTNFRSCLFVNTLLQFTLCKEKEENKKDYAYFEIDDKFKIVISKEELEKIKKELPNVKYIISPFLLLYKFFLKDRNEKALWILNQKNFVTVSVFKDGSALFSRQIKKDEELKYDEFVKEIIKEFYKSECCYFLEEILIFDAEGINQDEVEKIYEKTLLETEYKSIDLKSELEKFCKDDKVLKYAIKIERENFSIPNWLKISIVFIFLFLGGLDLYFRYKNSLLQSQMIEMQNEKISLQKNIEDLTKKTTLLKSIVPIVQDIKSSNSLIKSNIKNIFELVPDEIVLKRAEFYKKSLVLEGFTPSKRDYFKLDKSLKSFYQIRDVKFEKKNRKYLFLSINKEAKVNNGR
ncbi:hypothetical protein [Nitrosophilus labii]|uniref:hypothetical protein n=1 Tax=Nitrosophilus labii TaxID=2706014 RepID=UPI001656B169|nr:hypothetical protein [Nitrosophilus labii]